MSTHIIPPVYSQIALDIASRIVRGDLKENSKIYGRSIMSSEYGVSPETIRRAMKLLEDMGIVQTKDKSGTTVLSAEKAKLYVERFGEENSVRAMRDKLVGLTKQQENINKQIIEISGSIIRVNEMNSQANPFNNYEINIPDNSSVIGYTLGDINFWQETQATVIAIRREGKIILSPGPYVLFKQGDTVVFIGDVSCVQTVTNFFNR